VELGPVVTGGDVHAAVTASLQTHLPGILDQLSTDRNLDPPLDRPRTWHETVRVSELMRNDRWLPAIAVASFAGQVEFEYGADTIDAVWPIDVAVAVRVSSETRELHRGHTYVAAIRTALLADRSVGGVAADLWLSTQELEPVEQSGTVLLVGSVSARLRVGEVAAVPPVGGPAVQTTPIDVKQKE
jgi:hypothetical protein